MPLADFETIDVLWIVLSAFLVVVGLALAYLLIRLSGTAGRLTRLLKGLEESVLPLVGRVDGTVARVNHQLDKADRVTTSLVEGVDAADTAVRAVSMAVTRPVTKISGIAQGVSTGFSTFFSGGDVSGAVDAGRTAKARREREIAEDLGRPVPAPSAAVPPPGAAQPEAKEPQPEAVEPERPEGA